MTGALVAHIASAVVLAASVLLPWLTITGASGTFRASLLYSRVTMALPGIAVVLIVLALLFAWRRWSWTVVLMRSLSLSAIITIVPVVGYYRELTTSARSLELRAGSLRGLIGDPQGAAISIGSWVAVASAAACYLCIRKLPTRQWLAWPVAVLLGASLMFSGVVPVPGRIQPNVAIAGHPFLAAITGMRTGGFVERAEALPAEHIAPNFSLRSPSGEEVTLAQFRGKHVVLNFWATWCGPCIYEMPLLERLYQRHRNDFVLLALSVDEQREKVVPFMKKLNLSFPALFSTLDVEKAYGVSAYPTSFVVSPSGRIELAVVGTLADDHIRAIEQMLGKP